MGCHQTDAAEQAARHTRVNDRRVPNGIFWVLRSGRSGGTCRTFLVRTPPATIASSGGGGRASGIRCWMLMGIDEAGTLARLKALRRDLIDPQISAHSGRGDGVSNRDQEGVVNHKWVGKLVVRDIRRQAA